MRKRLQPVVRPTSWWLAILKKRAERMYEETLDLGEPIVWASEEERQAAIAFFNAAYRAEESGLTQAHELASAVAAWDPELGECLRLYGDEEGWHRELLTKFLAHIGGEIRPMGRVTGTFYALYGRAERMETIVLTNLMFETIGSTTYRLSLRSATHPAVRQMLTILTRDESFHVPLNVHFLRQILARAPRLARLRLLPIYHLLYASLMASAYASRRRALAFDKIPFPTLARAYAEQLGRLFVHESDLAFEPSWLLLRLVGLGRDELLRGEGASAVTVAAAEAAIDRERVVVTALLQSPGERRERAAPCACCEPRRDVVGSSRGPGSARAVRPEAGGDGQRHGKGEHRAAGRRAPGLDGGPRGRPPGGARSRGRGRCRWPSW